MDINSFALGYSAGKKKGGVALNIAYGDTAPEDTAKLWVKTDKPSKVFVTNNFRWENDNHDNRMTKMKTFTNGNRTLLAKVGNRVYGLGGGSTTKINYYDLETQETVTTGVKTYNGSLYDGGCCAVGTNIYIFGGASSTGYFSSLTVGRIYDTEAETVVDAPASYTGGVVKCIPIGTKIHIFGGRTGNAPTAYSDIHKIYDIETGEMKDGASLPVPLYAYGYAVTDDEKIYLLGGISTGNNATDSIIRYDPKEDKMTTMTSKLPQPMADVAGAVVGQKIYIFGGASAYYGTAGVETYNDIYCYDTGRYVDGNHPIEKVNATVISTQGAMNNAFLYNGAVIVFPKTQNGITPEMFEWATNPTVDDGTLQIVPNETKNFCTILNSDTVVVEIGVKEVFKGNANNDGELVEVALYKDDTWTTI